MTQTKYKAGTPSTQYTAKDLGNANDRLKLSRIASAFKILRSGSWTYKLDRSFSGMIDCVRERDNDFAELTDDDLKQIRERVNLHSSSYNAYIYPDEDKVEIACHYLATWTFRFDGDLTAEVKQ
jgi:hypothetical protein